MAEDTLNVTVKVRIRGLWRIALLGWAIKTFGLGPAHVQIEVVADK